MSSEATLPDSFSVQEWRECWETGKTDWIGKEGKVDDCLLKHYADLTAKRENLRILVPFCGQSYDMKWLADEGHSIVGVECSDKGIKMFFDGHKIEYSVHREESVDGNLYVSTDGRFKIYACDFYYFSVSTEGKFSAIWDSGAFQAANEGDLQKYMDVMMSLMADDCRYVMVAQYETSEEKSPYSKSASDITALLGVDFELNTIGSVENAYCEDFPDFPPHTLYTYLITKKGLGGPQ